MATFWVKQAGAGGNDGNAGDSPFAAWATLARAAQRVWQPGDLLLISGGLHPNTGPSGAEFRGGGTAAAPVVVRPIDPADRPLLHFGARGGWKLNLCGQFFVLEDVRVTQDARGQSPGDRQVVCQRSADETSMPADNTIRRVESFESYEPFKLQDGPRHRLEDVHAHHGQIGIGILGYADDCVVDGGLFHDITANHVQTKAGCRNAVVRRTRHVVTAATPDDTTLIYLGGSSTINDGSAVPWWREDGYEGSAVLVDSPLIVASEGAVIDAAFGFNGALNARVLNPTVVNTSGVTKGTNGIKRLAVFFERTGGNWAVPPNNSGIAVEGALCVNVPNHIENWGSVNPAGANLYRNNTLFGATAAVPTAGGLGGAWTIAGIQTGDPRLLRVGADPWSVDPRTLPGSPARAAAAPVVHAKHGGAGTLPTGRDLYGLARGPVAWDRGCADETARERRRSRRRQWRGWGR